MALIHSRLAARLRRRFGLRAVDPPAEPLAQAEPAPEPAPAITPPEVAPTPLAALRRGLGERPAAGAPDQAAEAELDTLRGELVRELDRLAGNERRPGS